MSSKIRYKIRKMGFRNRVSFLITASLLLTLCSSSSSQFSSVSGGQQFQNYYPQYIPSNVQKKKPVGQELGGLILSWLKRQEMPTESGGSEGGGFGETMMEIMTSGLDDPGFDGALKILLAIFPFVLPLIFVPLLLITIGVLLLPFIAFDNFRSLSNGRRSLSGVPENPWPHEMYLHLFDNISFSRILDRIAG